MSKVEVILEVAEVIGHKGKWFWDSILSYALAAFLVFYGFVVDHGSGIMIFLGVMAGLLRIAHDGIKTWKAWKA